LTNLSALWYLEWRQIANRVKRAFATPSRALIYVLAGAYLIFMSFVRSRSASPLGATAPEPYASALLFAYITALGIVMYGGASGIVGAFGSTADARFLTGSLINQRAVTLWLQLRRCAASMARMIFTMVLYTLILGPGTSTGITVSVLGGTAAATASAIPMLKLRNVIGTRTAQSVAGLVAVLGIFPMAILFASLPGGRAVDAAHGIEHLGAGHAFNQLFAGSPLAIGALYAFTALVVVLAYAAGTDLYPDLYAASMRSLQFRTFARRGGSVMLTVHHTYRSGATRVPFAFAVLRGAWVLVWKEWIAFARSPSMQRSLAFGVVACAAVGWIFGNTAYLSSDRFHTAMGFMSVAGNMVVLFVAMGSAIGLSADIAKPLWWMGPDSLWRRLLAWTVGTSWRLGVCLVIAAIGWSIGLRSWQMAAAAIPSTIAVVLCLRAVGLVIYALFPSTLDQRGPLAFIRALLTYTFSAPPGIAGFVVFFFARSFAAGIAAGIAVAVAEMLLLISFAAWRIAGQGAAIARAESM
jgi:hypothetical protein